MVDIFGSNVIKFVRCFVLCENYASFSDFFNLLAHFKETLYYNIFLSLVLALVFWGPKAIREDVPRVPTAIFAVGQVYPGGLTVRQPH